MSWKHFYEKNKTTLRIIGTVLGSLGAIIVFCFTFWSSLMHFGAIIGLPLMSDFKVTIHNLDYNQYVGEASNFSIIINQRYNSEIPTILYVRINGIEYKNITCLSVKGAAISCDYKTPFLFKGHIIYEFRFAPPLVLGENELCIIADNVEHSWDDSRDCKKMIVRLKKEANPLRPLKVNNPLVTDSYLN